MISIGGEKKRASPNRQLENERSKNDREKVQAKKSRFPFPASALNKTKRSA